MLDKMRQDWIEEVYAEAYRHPAVSPSEARMLDAVHDRIQAFGHLARVSVPEWATLRRVADKVGVLSDW